MVTKLLAAAVLSFSVMAFAQEGTEATPTPAPTPVPSHNEPAMTGDHAPASTKVGKRAKKAHAKRHHKKSKRH